MTLAFCPVCGAKRLGGARHCTTCGADFWKAAAGSVTALTAPSDAREWKPSLAAKRGADVTGGTHDPNPNAVLIVSGAWIGSAAAIGYLAFLQLQFASTGLPGANDAGGVAAWNGVSAVVTLYFGARLLMAPTRRLLTNSTLWAALTVAWGAYQVSQGVTAGVYIIALVLAGVAGILSFVIRGTMPRPAASGP